MILTTVIDISAATLGLFSGAFFCVGVLHVKDSTLETIATNVWGKGTTIAIELAQQKSDFNFGAVFLFLSFFVQIVGKCLPTDVALSVVTTSTTYGVVFGLVGPVILLCVLYVSYSSHRENKVRKLMAAIKGKV